MGYSIIHVVMMLFVVVVTLCTSGVTSQKAALLFTSQKSKPPVNLPVFQVENRWAGGSGAHLSNPQSPHMQEMMQEMEKSGEIKNIFGQKVHVHIFNNLGDGKSINIHCQSKNDDLGPQTVADGAVYGWHFSVNFFGTTLFYCNMGLESVKSLHFDAYDYRRDNGRCSSDCSWIVVEKGVYGVNEDTGTWVFMYSWNS